MGAFNQASACLSENDKECLHCFYFNSDISSACHPLSLVLQRGNARIHRLIIH